MYIIVAAALWAFMFSSKTADIVPFWYAMLGATGILILLSFRHIKWEKPLPKDVCLGIVSAIVLWGIFWVGNYFSTRWFGFAAQNIQSIYNIKSDFNPLFLSLILLFWIGPAEEIFWRGFLQRQWSEKLGANLGFVLTAVLYAGVHIVSLNFMLVMAALVCGIFWGLIYKYTNRLWPVIISHALWDCAVFLWFPIS
ncbi:MAG: CPBP family intramembrane metalloprotease [Bacteroidales bacterium]|nr:CPBP family intramembrane metalloprotease [Bacteroidales bacterium]